MNEYRQDSLASALIKVLLFALVRGAPSLYTLILVLALSSWLGVDAYGTFSLLTGYALLIGNVTAAIIIQPMLRFLPTHPQDSGAFGGLALWFGAFSATLTVFSSIILEVVFLEALVLGLFCLSIVLASIAAAKLAIAGDIKKMIAFEILRILPGGALIATLIVLEENVEVIVVVGILAVSNTLPLILPDYQLNSKFPNLNWIKRVTPIGYSAAIWIFLAGLPYISARFILERQLTPVEFGAYTATLDLSYRVFGMLNSIITLWSFPRLSELFDTGAFDRVRKTLKVAISIYTILGIIALSAMELLRSTGFLSFSENLGNSWQFTFILATSWLWQLLSISHKVIELKMMATKTISFMMLAIFILYISFTGFHYVSSPPLLSVNLSIVIAASVYLFSCWKEKIE